MCIVPVLLAKALAKSVVQTLHRGIGEDCIPETPTPTQRTHSQTDPFMSQEF